MKIDGELSETAYENRNWFENYLSEDLDGTSAHIAVTTVTGEKGWYVAAKVYDTGDKIQRASGGYEKQYGFFVLRAFFRLRQR